VRNRYEYAEYVTTEAMASNTEPKSAAGLQDQERKELEEEISRLKDEIKLKNDDFGRRVQALKRELSDKERK
jgi:hypothetical protein